VKYSSRSFNDPAIRFPLHFPLKIIVDYMPGGVLVDYAPLFYSADPEPEVDVIVKERGWDKRPGYDPADVWVNWGF
jgi:hypothetical protein